MEINKINEIAFAFDNQTILMISKKSLSFITIIPLEQTTNFELAGNDEKSAYNKKIKSMISQLKSYDTGAAFKSATYGATYKVISSYSKLSPLQKYQLKKGYDLEKILQNKIKNKKSFFMQQKELYSIDEILKINEYEKKDYLVVRTYLIPDNIKKIIGEKVGIYSFFSSLDLNKYTQIEQALGQLHQSHASNIPKKIEDDLFHSLNPQKIIKVLSSIETNIETAFFNDFNVYQKNLYEPYNDKNINFQISIYINDTDIKPDVYIFRENHLYIRKSSSIKSQLIKLSEEQKVVTKYAGDNNERFQILLVDEKKTIIVEEYYVFDKIEISNEKKFTYKFTLAEIPTDMKNNLSEISSSNLKNAGYEDFSILSEIIKKPTSNLEKLLKSNKYSYNILNGIPSLNNLIYKKDVIEKKILAIEAMEHYIGEGEEFSNVKFGFNLTLPYEINEEFLINDINSIFKNDNLVFEILPKIISMFNSTSSYFPYNSVDEKVMQLSNSELEKIINLKYGNDTFGRLKDNVEGNLPKIDDAYIYVKTNEKIQAVNLFMGPDMFNGLIIAPTGAGKSFITVNLIDGFLTTNKDNLCWILDRGGSYVNFTDIKEGINIHINKTNKKNCINPFVFDNYYSKLILIENTFFEIDNIDKIVNKNNLKKINLKKEIENLNNENKKGYEEDINKLTIELNEIEEKIKEEKENIYQKMKLIKKLISITEFKNKDSILYDKYNNPASTNFEGLIPQDKLEIFVTLLKEMLEFNEVEPNQAKIIEKNIYELFKKLIVGKTIFTENNDRIHYLLISEIKDELEDLLTLKAKFKIEDVQGIIFTLEEYIDPLRSGKLFNGEPKLNMESNLINIDFGEIQNEKLSNLVLSSLLMNYFNIMTSDKYKASKKILIIDEAHAILNSPVVAGLKSVSYLFRTARKHGASVFLLSQAISDFQKNAGEVESEKKNLFDGIITNAGWTFLLGMHLKKDTMERLELNEEVATKIYEVGTSRRFYLKSKVSGFAELIVSDLNYAISTTNKEEKNILKSIGILTQNIENSLLIFTILFGKNFISEYKDVNILKSSYGSEIDENAFSEELEFLYEDFEKSKKIKHIKKILGSQLFDKEIINVLLIKAITLNKLDQLKEIINDCEKFIN
jgi:hypothetical protein